MCQKMSPKHRAVATCLLSSLALLLGTFNAATAQFGAKKESSEDKIKLSASVSKPNSAGQRAVAVKIIIEKGWYIYANPVGDDTFANNATELIIKSKGKKVKAKVEYPVGKTKKLGKFSFETYRDKATIRAIVLEPTTGPLEIGIRVNSCSNEGVCLTPGTKTIKTK